MSIVSVKVFVPSFKVDCTGAGIVEGDYAREDLARIVGQPRVLDEALSLYRLAPAPTLAFVCSPGCIRALAAHFRIGGLRAAHVDDGGAIETARQLVADLGAGRLDVLISVRRLGGTSAIPRLHAIMSLQPTRLGETFRRCITRLDTATGEVTIYDLVGNVARHGLPNNWNIETIVGQPAEVIRDPYLTKLADLPHRTAMQWAGSNIERIVLLQRATGRKDGWSYHVLETTAGKATADRWWQSRKSS